MMVVMKTKMHML